MRINLSLAFAIMACLTPLGKGTVFANNSTSNLSSATITLEGEEANQFIATLEAGGVEKDAEHRTDDGGIRFSINRLSCTYVFHSESEVKPTTCNVLYSDRMSEDGRHYKTVDLEPEQARTIYTTLKGIFGVRHLGHEFVTGAQDIVCLIPVEGETSCQLSRLQQPRRPSL